MTSQDFGFARIEGASLTIQFKEPSGRETVSVVPIKEITAISYHEEKNWGKAILMVFVLPPLMAVLWFLLSLISNEMTAKGGIVRLLGEAWGLISLVGVIWLGWKVFRHFAASTASITISKGGGEIGPICATYGDKAKMKELASILMGSISK